MRAAVCEAYVDDDLPGTGAALLQDLSGHCHEIEALRIIIFNIPAMVVAGSGARGKRMLCSSGAAFDDRKLMAMRHALCTYWFFRSLTNSCWRASTAYLAGSGV